MPWDAVAMGTLAADPANARVVIDAVVAAGRLPAFAPDLGIERRAAPLPDGRAAFGADLRVEFRAVLVTGGSAPPASGLGARLGSWLAAVEHAAILCRPFGRSICLAVSSLSSAAPWALWAAHR